MEKNNELQIENIWDDIQKNCLTLKILMCGKTGVGKTSVVNALIGEEVGKVSADAAPCTKTNCKDLLWSTEMGDISITDVPGFGEANAPTIDGVDYEQNIRNLAKDAHILLMVIKGDDKALELEENFLKKWKNDEKLCKIPVLIVVNQIDKMKPVRVWDPENLNLDHPSNEKERYIKSYIDYLSTLPTFSSYGYLGRIIPVSAGEYTGDLTYGIDKLKKQINDNIPDMLKLIIEREHISKEEKINKIINYYSFAAGSAAIQPIPLIDSAFLAPIQVAMVIHIGKIHKIKITKGIAGGLVSAIGLSFLGNILFISLVSFFPGIKQLLGPAIAYSLTYTSGLIVNELFSTGNLNPTKEQLRELCEKYKGELKDAKKRYEDNEVK